MLSQELLGVDAAGLEDRVTEVDASRTGTVLTQSISQIRDRNTRHTQIQTIVNLVAVWTSTVFLIDMRRASGHALPGQRLTVADISYRVNRIHMIRAQFESRNRVATERTGHDGVIRTGFGVRFAVPDVGLTIRNTGYGRADLRIHLRDGDAQSRVTTIRRHHGVEVHTGSGIGLTQELQTTAMTDVLAHIGLRYVPDCQVQPVDRL